MKVTSLTMYHETQLCLVDKKTVAFPPCFITVSSDSWGKIDLPRRRQSPVESTEMAGRESRGDTEHTSAGRTGQCFYLGNMCCVPFQASKITSIALSGFLGWGKTALRLQICRLLYIFITLNNLFAPRKGQRTRQDAHHYRKSHESMFKSSYLM